ncbi:MarR family winged helix-turn-helix transcriptional regulator [Murimonas intestini]|uniref:MarR family transcriptional regulator n=1 Tax=Murimonas intestini TaxID=1337051 RepID=A0AB73T8J6_9FIRM|nr:MarR family transcriptional regulator [Murimonas intestini]MCR1840040.1 MarR family transcriptional regulator [Murimonas intestini]MCR1866878.1 MarR family transcriptional regulator [Murimonas intestini]MCR1883711.1 MarR family transcriptional regulator [Murimonas intestini]
MKLDQNKLEEIFFEYFDRIKTLISSETWENALLNSSKNELLILLLLYRRQEVNMTQIAEYIHVPLNTATGIVDRMEKKKLAVRQRSREDKRVVTISLAEAGKEQLGSIIREFVRLGEKVTGVLTAEELETAGRILDKVLLVLTEEQAEDKPAVPKKVRKIVIE